MKVLRSLIPSKTALVALGWRYRNPLLSWSLFVAGAPVRLLEGGGNDMVLEARIRAALLMDDTLRAGRVRLGVYDGVVTLDAPDDIRPKALAIIRKVGGVGEVVESHDPARSFP